MVAAVEGRIHAAVCIHYNHARNVDFLDGEKPVPNIAYFREKLEYRELGRYMVIALGFAYIRRLHAYRLMYLLTHNIRPRQTPSSRHY